MSETKATKRPTLRQRIAMRLFGDIIEQQAAASTIAALASQAAASTVDKDDAAWRPLTRSRRDLTPVDQDKIIEIANFLVRSNPIASRGLQIQGDFVLGEGVKIVAEDKETIQPLLDEFWSDPVNNFDEFQFQLYEGLSTNGELFLPVYVNEFTGFTRLGWLDPSEVLSVIRDQLNRRIMRQVVLKGVPVGDESYTTQGKRRYNIVNVETSGMGATRGFRVGELLFFKINCAADATRGRSYFEPVADLLDAFDQSVFNELEREAILKNFFWDITLTGASEAECDKFAAKQMPPAPGSTRVHNEKVQWQAVAPDLKTEQTIKLHEAIRKTILGSLGLSDFYFGITEGANRASSENLDVPIAKGFVRRQRLFKAILREILDFYLDQRILKDKSLRHKVYFAKSISRKFEIQMPEISMRDVSRLAAAVSQMVAAVESAINNEWITKKRGAQIFASQMQQIGVEYDSDEELAAAEKEAKENAAKDYRNKPPMGDPNAQPVKPDNNQPDAAQPIQ